MLTPQVESLIRLALDEDLAYGDITTDSLFNENGQESEAVIVTRQPAVVSGIGVARRVFELIDPTLEIIEHVENSDCVPAHAKLMTIRGNTPSILKGERLALNFLQHLSGIATQTYLFVGAIGKSEVKITHTRKTTPGLRPLEIQAVVDGRGHPHRSSLSHAILIKDNHIQAAGSILKAVEKIRQSASHTVKIEVECDTLEQVEEALKAKADIIMLDNMDIATLKTAVRIIKGRALTEASGGINLDNVEKYAKTGVDIISTSQITLGAPPVDIGLDFTRNNPPKVSAGSADQPAHR